MANKKKRNKKINDKKIQLEQNKRLWRELFELIGHIFALHPWDHFESGNVFALALQDGDQAVFFDIEHNRLPQTRSLTIYPSRADYVRFLTASEYSGREQVRQQIEMARCTLFLTDRSQIPQEMLACIERVGVSFGNGLWPWIEYKKQGCVSVLPDDEALTWLLDVLGHFRMQLRSIVVQGQRVDFAHGEMLLRLFNTSSKVWLNVTTPFVLPPVQPPVSLCEDRQKLTDLLACPRAKQLERVEFDFGWLPEPVQDVSGGAPYHPVVLVFTDRLSQQTLLTVRCHPDEIRAQVLSIWCHILEQYGRPETLYLSRDESLELFTKLADEIDVRVKQVKRLPTAERVLRECDAI